MMYIKQRRPSAKLPQGMLPVRILADPGKQGGIFCGAVQTLISPARKDLVNNGVPDRGIILAADKLALLHAVQRERLVLEK